MEETLGKPVLNRAELVGHTRRFLQWNYRDWHQALAWIVILIFLVISLFPIYWLSMTALRSRENIFNQPVLLQPVALSAENINYVLFGSTTNDPIIRFLGTSLIISIIATIFATAIGVMCAYGLARYRVGGNLLSMWILSQRFLPPIALIVPLFVIFKAINFLDTYHGLIFALHHL